MLSHCNKKFSGYTFFVADNNYLVKKVECTRCPVCGVMLYREYRTNFHNKVQLSKLLSGKEAEIAYSKALSNRLIFISKVQQGTRAKQNWCYGDFKYSNNEQYQIKRNMNGEEVENLGVSKIAYR